MKIISNKRIALWLLFVVVVIVFICVISSSFFQLRFKVLTEKGENLFYREFCDVNRKTYNHFENNKGSKCIISFIDDDSGIFIPEIWGPIIDSTGIKMGFACITGYMSGIEAPEVYRQVSIDTLRLLYNSGHDVYSHSSLHRFFYQDSVDLKSIDEQCRDSKEWLISNGFERNANIIVYPGGLGSFRTKKKDVVRKYYEYGIDAGGNGGINPEPLDNWSVCRYNADIASLNDCIAQVDKAIESGALLVFMNHAYELNKDKDNQISKMISLINYIKEKGVGIMPLSEALEIKGNIIAEGEYSGNNSHFISTNGQVKCGHVEKEIIYKMVVICQLVLIFLLVYIVLWQKRHYKKR